jgi:hypothetical protein
MLIDAPGDRLIQVFSFLLLILDLILCILQTSSLMMTAVVIFSYPLLSYPMRLAIEEVSILAFFSCNLTRIRLVDL